MLRCIMCGRPAGDDPEARAREEAARNQAGAAGQAKKPVWICPLCQGRARYEAEEGGHGLTGRDPKPL